ncbi:MAG: nuclear transport factor 2 family protein [Candidatus Acidiferrales bacterium]
MLCRVLTAFKNHLWAGGVLVAFAVALAAAPRALPQNRPITLSTLIDRAQIQDMLVDYYSALSAGSTHFDSYYADDATVDVNGIIKHGKGAIDDLYKTIPKSKGTIHVLLTNPKIVVDGNSATADVIWTEVYSENHRAIPHIVEQGREHDELVKRAGRWYLHRRVVTNDGGLPASLEKYYQAR